MEILTQDEIDALLSVIGTSEVGPNDSRVRLYDFRRPKVLTKFHLRSMLNIHKRAARLISVSMSEQMDLPVGVYAENVIELHYDDFISFSNPSIIATIQMDPMPLLGVLEIDPNLTFAMIDRLAGGPGESAESPSRPLTEIELSLMEGQIVRILGCLREGYNKVVDLRPRLASIETDPRLVNQFRQEGVMIGIEVKFGDMWGTLNLYMPAEVPLILEDNCRELFDDSVRVRAAEAKREMSVYEYERTLVKSEGIQCRVNFAHKEAIVRLGQLAEVREGDTLLLGLKRDAQNIDIRIENSVIGHGKHECGSIASITMRQE